MTISAVLARVPYNGIKVGDVIELRLDDKDPRRVLALIRLAANTPVKVDTKAKLALTGVTGTSIIQLSGGDPNSPPLKGKDGKLPVIVASPSPIARLLTDGTDVISNVNMLLHNANKLFSPENVDSFGKTLSNLEQTTTAISSQRGDIAQTLKQLSQVGKQATAALEQTTTLMRNANGILNTQGQQMFSDAGKAMKSLEQSTQTINSLINNNEDSLNNGMQGLNQLGPAVNELRETLSTLRAISRRLEANPSGFLLNREQTKEFTP